MTIKLGQTPRGAVTTERHDSWVNTQADTIKFGAVCWTSAKTSGTKPLCREAIYIPGYVGQSQRPYEKQPQQRAGGPSTVVLQSLSPQKQWVRQSPEDELELQVLLALPLDA